MNSRHLGRTSALIVFLMLVLGAVSVMAQREAAQVSSREKVTMRAEVQRPATTSFWAVTQEFEGSFDDVADYMAKFTEEAKRQGVPNSNPTGILVLYEDPEGKSRFRMAVGLSVVRKVEVKEPLKAEWLKFSGVHHTVVGSYAKLAPVGRAFKSTLTEAQSKNQRRMAVSDKGGPFAVLILRTDPKKVSPERNQTEIIIPVRY